MSLIRGSDHRSGSLFSYVDLETRVESDHLLRMVRALVDGAFSRLDGDFSELYSGIDRPSIPPEQLLQALYSLRSERQLMEGIDYDLQSRWFVGLGIDNRCETSRRSPKTATACSKVMWRPGSAECV